MKGLLKTLIKPDHDDNPLRSKIVHASNLLQVGEFQLIQLAYKAWYKEDLPEEKINKIFSEYMYRQIIPIWVTYYANDIIKINKCNKLNSNDDKYHTYDHEFGRKINDEQQRKKLGLMYCLIIMLVFVGTHIMAIKVVDEPVDFLPPYFEKKIIYPELIKEKK